MGNVREFQAIYTLVDNLTRPLQELKRNLDSATGIKTVTIQANTGNLGSKIAESGANFQKGFVGGGKAAEGAIKNVGKATDEVANAAKKVEGGFGNIKKAAGELHSSIMNIATSLAGLALGGSVAGFSWIGAEKAENYKNQVYAAINANGQWKLSVGEVSKAISDAADAGWTSEGDMLKTIQTTATRASKYVRGQALIDVATGAQKLGMAQDVYQGGGEGLVNLATRKFGSASSKFGMQQRADFAGALEAIGMKVSVLDPRLNSVQGKLKLLKEANEKLTPEKMDEAKLAHPWEAASIAIEKLNKSIGKSLAPTLNYVSGLVTHLAEYLAKRPDIAWMIGMGAILVAAAGAAGLLYSALMPMFNLFRAIKEATLAWKVANEGLAGSELLAFAPLFIVAGILLLVEQRTHIFSKALKELGKTQLAKDFFKWFEEGGKWIDKMIANLDKLYKAGGAKDLLKLAGAMALGPAGLIGAAIGTGGPDKLQENLVKYMYNLYNLARSHFPWLDKAGEILKKIQSLFEWLYSLLQGLWNWLKSSIPGAAKADAGKKLETELKRAVPDNKDLSKLSYAGMGINKDTSAKEPMFNWKGTQIPLSSLTGGKGSSYGGTYMDLPGLSSLQAHSIGIKALTYEKLPDTFASLIEAINGLKDAFNGYVAKQVTQAVAPVTNVVQGVQKSMSPKTYISPTTGTNEMSAQDIQGFLGYDVGATVKSSGHAIIHRGEEVVPKVQATRGPGAVAKVLDMMSRVSNGQPSGSGNGSTTIEIHNHNDFSGAKISSQIDINRLWRDIDKRIETKSLESVKRSLGQRRT